MWILKFIEENLPIYICLLAAMGILLGVSLIVKGKFQKQRDKMLDGIGKFLCYQVCSYQNYHLP